MPDQFTFLANNFSKQKWTETCLEFAASCSVLDWPLGRIVYAGDKAGRIHSIDTGGQCPVIVSSLTVSSSEITSLTVNKSSDLFACTSTDTGFVTIGTVDPVNCTVGPTTVDLSCTQRPLCALFMDDERSKQSLILVGCSAGIDILDAHSGAVFRRLTSNGGATSFCSWHGCMLAGGDTHGGVTLWDARVNEPVHHFSTECRTAKRAVFSVDGAARVLAVAGGSGATYLFDIAARKQITKKKIFPSDVNVLCFSPKMRFLLASDAKRLRLVNLQSISLAPFPDPTHDILTPKSVVTGARWDPSSCRFVIHATDRQLRFYQLLDFDNP